MKKCSGFGWFLLGAALLTPYSAEKNEEKVGTVTEVLIEGWDDYIKCYFGRTPADAPEVDGKIFFMSTRPLKIGDFAKVRVNDCLDYDLLGELCE